MNSFIVNTTGKDLAEVQLQVHSELERAISKHPVWPDCNIRRAAIILEEAGELIKEANLLSEGIGSLLNLKTEIVQTAATCIRMLIALKNDENGLAEQPRPVYYDTLTKENINSTLIKNVTHIRKSMNLSQKDFATRYRIRMSTVGAYEEGRSTPSHLLLVQISDDVKIDIKTLLTVNLNSK